MFYNRLHSDSSIAIMLKIAYVNSNAKKPRRPFIAGYFPQVRESGGDKSNSGFKVTAYEYII
jgi:hypothetical protein